MPSRTACGDGVLSSYWSGRTVWRCWTYPQRMCDWWAAAAELDPRPGGACQVGLGGGSVMMGQFVELVPHERNVFTFGWGVSNRVELADEVNRSIE